MGAAVLLLLLLLLVVGFFLFGRDQECESPSELVRGRGDPV